MHLGSHMEMAYLSTQLMVWLLHLGVILLALILSIMGYQLIQLSNPQRLKVDAPW